jgi:hypothetical protein
MRGSKSFGKLQRDERRAIAGGAGRSRRGVGRSGRRGGQFGGWRWQRRRVARSSARAPGHLGVLGNFRDVQSELFTDDPTTPHYNILAVPAAFVLVELAGALSSSLLLFSEHSSQYGDE